jgi:hypothetical protein
MLGGIHRGILADALVALTAAALITVLLHRRTTR